MHQSEYDVVVIGGGHAGVEAAWACANVLGTRRDHPCVALVTMDPGTIGVMSCNPAIGGLAKGQIVREIDALGGLMPLAADATGIMFKVLNRSRGHAVFGPRAQCDKHAYAEAVRMLIASRPEIQVIRGAVEDLVVTGGRIAGVVMRSPEGVLALNASSVVLTTGTFMRGLMHVGDTQRAGGRFGEGSAGPISDALTRLGFELGRLKTGTPPRLARETIRWEALERQEGDEPPAAFSDLSPPASPHRWPKGSGRDGGHLTLQALAEWAENGLVLPRFPLLGQVECRLTATTPASHALIRENLHRAPMYSGQIQSAGPRYCPSIEDKVVRFADKETHQVFLEPESHRDCWVYCNGISTSLPAEVQEEIVRSMPGCENARILRHGYAVEYDMVRPHQISVTGMSKLTAGLFLAGQINGTSGYEEAAGQGLVAGVNAARWALGEPEFTLGRHEAYIGVMMDDLVTKTPVEPYRMFTSRAEHRLRLRADNVADRLTGRGIAEGVVGDSPLGRGRARAFEQRQHARGALERAISLARVDGVPVSRLLRRPEFGVEDLRRAVAAEVTPSLGVLESAWADHRYAAYLARQDAEISRRSEVERRRIPAGIDYAAMGGLRVETREALMRFRPETLGQAARLEGVTPADVTLLSVLLGGRR